MVLEAIGGCSPKDRQLGHAGGKFFFFNIQKKIAKRKKSIKGVMEKTPQKIFLLGGNRRLVSQGQATGPSR